MFILSFHTWYFATPSYYHFWSRPNVWGFSSDIFFSLAPLEFGRFIWIASFFLLYSDVGSPFTDLQFPLAWNMFELGSVVNVLTSKQELKPTRGTKCTRDLVASMADSAQPTWSTPRPFWRGKRESIGLLVTARHENRLYEHTVPHSLGDSESKHGQN